MDEVISSGVRISAALILVLLNGLFVAAEFAFVRIRTTQVDRLVRDRRPSAGLVKIACQKLDQYLAVCQLGITICSLGIGALAEPAIADLIEPGLGNLGIPETLLHPIALTIALSIASFLHVVFGELAPKTFAIQRAERTSLFVAPFMRFFYYLLYPLTTFFNGTANAITGALGVAPASESDETHSEEEIRQLIAQSTRSGILEKNEEEMLEGIFDLEDTPVREIMVPTPDVAVLPAGMGLEELFAVAAEGQHTRYPVQEDDSPDKILGTVHVKDVLRAIRAEGLDARVTASDLVREVLTVPESRRVSDVLRDLRQQEMRVAIVIDEWGSFEGLVTVEDIVEEIVGELRDEFDEEEEPLVREVEDGYRLDGRTPIRVVNKVLDSDLASEEFDTVGGLIFGQLGHVPAVGDEVRLDGHLLRVEEVDGARIVQVAALRNPG